MQSEALMLVAFLVTAIMAACLIQHSYRLTLTVERLRQRLLWRNTYACCPKCNGLVCIDADSISGQCSHCHTFLYHHEIEAVDPVDVVNKLHAQQEEDYTLLLEYARVIREAQRSGINPNNTY